MNPGDRVTVTIYGEQKYGNVDRIGRPGTSSKLVWIWLDGDDSQPRWFHPESVTPITDMQKQDA